MDEIYQAPLIKRTIASLLDGAMTILLAVGLFMLLINGAVDIGFHNLGLKLEQYHLQETSQLFSVRKDGDGNYLEISLYTYDLSKTEEHLRFANMLHAYYFDAAPGEGKTEAGFNQKFMLFNANTLQNAIYSIPSLDASTSSYVLKDEVVDVATNRVVSKAKTKEYNQAVANFYVDANKGVYHLAVTDFTSGAKFQEITGKLANAERLEALICIAVSTLIFLCLPTLINKHGESAFLHIMGICYADSYGYQVKWRHKLIRVLVLLLLWSSSAYLFGIPLAVNVIVSFATPSKRSVVDLASNMIAIDKKTSVIIQG